MDNKRPERRVKDNNDDDQHSFDSEDVLPLSTMVRKGSAITNRQKFTWSKSDLVHTEPVFSETDRKEYRNMAPVDAFEKIFDDEVFQFLADQSNLYAAFKNCNPSPNITANEMRCFIAILIVSGYNKVPSKRSFWDSGADLRNQMVYEAMRRDRFDIIMRYLHCADNNDLDKQDKMAKLRPFMELLKLRFKNHFIPEREIDYDESMIEYFGRHGYKQFIRVFCRDTGRFRSIPVQNALANTKPTNVCIVAKQILLSILHFNVKNGKPLERKFRDDGKKSQSTLPSRKIEIMQQKEREEKALKWQRREAPNYPNS
nr:unnamed protein product [Callosobruchus chinensis]